MIPTDTGGVGIEKNLFQIWVGPYAPPLSWMQSWKDQHPSWNYRIFDNDYLETTRFETRPQIEEYLRRGDYAGVADLMRYEILYAEGGFIAPSDAICYRPVDALFGRPAAYTVYENEMIRGKLVSPILACNRGNSFVGNLIERLAALDPALLDVPWKTTGNLLCTRMIAELQPDVVTFPSHYFVPVHYEGVVYEGGGQVFAKQMFGSTRRAYGKLGLLSRFAESKKRRYRRRRLSALRVANPVFDREWPMVDPR